MNSGWLKSSRSSRQRLHVDLRILPALNGRASGAKSAEILVPIDTKLRSTRESNGLGGEMSDVDLG